MKKAVWLALILMLLCVFALSACDNADTPPNNDNGQQTTDENGDNNSPENPTVCQHTFGEWDTVKQATCKEEGKRTRTCNKCSETEEESIQKSETHTTVIDAAVPATCKDTGLTEGSHCSVCNKIIVEQTIIPITHTPVTDAAVPATCKDTGLTEGSHCSVCNKVLVAQTVAPKTEDHTPVTDAAVPATCKDTGLTEGSHCSFCGKILIEQIQIPKLDHTFVDGECSCGEILGLAMKLSNDETHYIVSGIGTYTDTVIIIPNTYKGKPVKAIDASAFSGNKNITHIVIGSEITDIYSYAFYQCTNLTGVTISSIKSWCNIKFQNSYANPLYYAGKLYVGNTLVTDLVIPDEIESINKFSFTHCTSIQSIQLGQNVKKIEYGAFHSCSELIDIELNNNLEIISDYAFFGCLKLATDLHFSDNLIEIGNYTFANASSLSSVYFGSSLKSIGSAAFQNCIKFESLIIPASTEFIGKYAFQNCSGIESVTFQITSGWKCSHASYPTSNMGEAALSYPPGAADFLTDIYADREWIHEN